MYDVHLGLIGKCIVDFLSMIIELFSLDVTAKAPRAKMDRKLAISLQQISLTQNFRGKATPPQIIFALIVKPMNALQLCR